MAREMAMVIERDTKKLAEHTGSQAHRDALQKGLAYGLKHFRKRVESTCKSGA